MFEKILVPVDGSETSWKAMEEAKKLAEAFHGEMVVVNVIQPYNNAALLVVPLDQATISQGNEELTKIGNSVLETAKEKMKDFKGKAEFLLEVGHPSERIIAVSKERPARPSSLAAGACPALPNSSWEASVPKFPSMLRCRSSS